MFFTISLNAQTDLPIQPEETPYLLKPNQFQIENSFAYRKVSVNEKIFVIPSFLIKYGLYEKIELRLQAEQIISKTEEKKVTGFIPLIVGLKTKLWKEKGFLPEAALVAQVGFPKIASKKFESEEISTDFLIMMQGNYGPKFSVNYNLGYKWEQINDLPYFVHKTTFGYLIKLKSTVYSEIFGQFNAQNEAVTNCNFGFMYQLSDNLMLDFSGGLGLSNTAPKHFFATIVSYRF